MDTDTDTAPRWAGLDEAETYSRVPRRTLRHWIAKGWLPAYRLGPRLIQVDLADLDGLDIDAQRRTLIRPDDDPRLAVITARLRELITATEEQLGQYNAWLFDLEDDHGPPGRPPPGRETRDGPAVTPSRPHVSFSPLQQEGCAAANPTGGVRR